MNKTTLYFTILIVAVLLALAGWFIIQNQPDTAVFPSMPHDGDSGFSPINEKPQESAGADIISPVIVPHDSDSGFSPVDEKPQESADTASPITILEPVPGGVGHDAEGWKKIKGIVLVVTQTTDAVSKVVFYLDRTIIGEVTSPEFDFEIDTTQYTDCMYLLRAKAYDAEGNELGEDRSQIWIDNTPTNCM